MFCALLIKAGQIADLKRPEDRVIDTVKYFFERPHNILRGKAKNLFEEKFTKSFDDLGALKASHGTDILSNFLRRHLRDKVELPSPESSVS